MTTAKRRPGAPYMLDDKLVWPCARCGVIFTRLVDRGEHYMSRPPCKEPARAPADGPRRTMPPWKLFEQLIAKSAKAQRAEGLKLERRAAAPVLGTRIHNRAGLDFEGDLSGRAIGLEAKSCEEGAFPTGKVSDYQAKRIRKAWERGVPVFLFVEMRQAGAIFAVPWPLLQRFRGGDLDPHRAIPLAVLEAEAIQVGRQPGRAIRLDLVAVFRAVAV